MKINIKHIVSIIIFIIIVSLIWKNFNQERRISKLTSDIEFYVDSINRYTKLYPSEDFKKLKKENRDLYNKLKDKENLIEAIEFEWKYKYEGLEQKIGELQETDSLYHFNIQTDTVGYDLKVWATHLAQYKINFNISNKFLLTHQQVNNENRFEINSQLPGKIQDVTIWTKPTKKKRFGVGMSIGAGYGLITKKPDLFVGVTGTYLIW